MLDIGALVKREKLYTRFDRSRGTFVIDEKRVKRRLERISEDTIIATHSVGQMIPPAWVRLAIVLRLDPTVLFRRLRARGFSPRKVWENVESELVDVCLTEAIHVFGKRKVFELDTTSKPNSRVVSDALRIVKNRKKDSGVRVDWLSVYDPVVLGRRFGWRSSS